MKALTFLLFLAASGLGGWAWWEHHERTRLEEKLATVTVERDRFAKTARSKTGLIAGMEIKEDGPRGLKDLDIPLEEEDAKQPDKPSLKKPGEKDLADGESGDAAQLQDPGVRAQQRAESEARINLEYRELLAELKLDDTQRESVLSLLKERAGKRIELGFRTMDQSISKEERRAASEELGRALNTATEELKKILGANWERFEKFDESGLERGTLDQFASLLSEKKEPLDEALRAKLLDAMYATRRAFSFDPDLQDVATLTPESVTDQMVDRYLEQFGTLQEQVQAKVKDLLTAPQLAQFVKAQEMQQQAAQSSLKVWRRLSGKGQSTDGRD